MNRAGDESRARGHRQGLRIQRNTGSRRGLLGTLLAVLLWLGCAGTARAESWGQYLVVIDDSLSMDKSDPSRLVMMASLALAGALGERDQVMIVGLNQLASGEIDRARFVSPGELLSPRDGPEGERTLTGERLELMAHHGGGTPCREALAGAQKILESVGRAGTPQTLLLLTDGECRGPKIEPAARWLEGLSSYADGRFRFALLTKSSGTGKRDGVDPALLAYATGTGWTTPAAVDFNARALLRAFAEVLSFSRGLHFGDLGGDSGSNSGRSFAGARELRVLAISTGGESPIKLGLADIAADSNADPIVGGPTFSHPDYGWSMRSAKVGPRERPFSVQAMEAVGVEVLAIPSYGALQVEAVVGPCPAPDETEGTEGTKAETSRRPPLPWTRERAVRSGQPACAWARLVGDRGATIHPVRSFGFDLELCEDQACSTPTVMQPAADGTFNAQLGVFAEGRHERWFRAYGGALVEPVVARRSVQSLAFGITSVARADSPDVPIDALDLGVLPQALPTLLTLEYSGSFPEGSEAEVGCRVSGDAGRDELLSGELACLRCVATPATVTLQDPFSIQVEIYAASFCPLLSESVGELPVALEVVVVGVGAAEAVGKRRVPIAVTLRHAVIEAQTAEVTGGRAATATLQFPSPVNAKVELELEPDPDDPDAAAALEGDLEVELSTHERRLAGAAGGVATVELELSASDCCGAGGYDFILHVRDAAGGPSLAVPVTVTVTKPSFWVCPGKRIAKWTAAALSLGLLIWLLRGFSSPAKFGETAVLARAESHKALVKVGEGDEDWRLVRSLDPSKRGFYKPATLHLGGPKAALPSLRGLGDDARIEARDHGNATLVVDAEGVEGFRESSGWTLLSPGEHPIGSSVTLRRDDTYLMFRR